MAAKKKVIKIGGSGMASDINEQFNQILGDGDLDPNIIGPKYQQLHYNIEVVCRVFKNFADFIKTLEDPRFIKPAEQMHTLRLRWNEELVENKLIKDLQEAYKTLKKCRTALSMLELYGALKQHEINIMEKNGEFIEDYPLDIFYIFRNIKLNFKDLYVYVGGKKEIKLDIQKYVMQFLELLCKTTKKIYQLISSPDIDVSLTARCLHSALMDLEKHLPQCRQAFHRIRNSIDMLEDNFTEYYKDYLGSQDQTMIMQSFINDIMKGEKKSIKIMWQFKQIIGFLQKRANASKSKDPRIKALFDKMTEMDRIVEEVKEEEPEAEEEPETESIKETEEDLESIKVAAE